MDLVTPPHFLEWESEGFSTLQMLMGLDCAYPGGIPRLYLGSGTL